MRTGLKVSPRALARRINRKLAKEDRQMRKNRVWDHNLGDYYVVEVSCNFIVGTHIDPEDLGRELGVLHEREALAAE
jgi:hypothetical protein